MSDGADAKLDDEAGRVAALRRYAVLDTDPEAGFEKITGLVKSVFAAPMTAISLVESDRQWFKSQRGLDVSETCRDVAFCNVTIRGRDCLAVEDATTDPRFAANPLVTGAPHIRSYLGAPLRTPEGYNIGALCVIDTTPRQFSDAQRAMLENFAALVVSELELRQIAARDALTGLLSRRAFGEALDRELARLAREGGASALAVFDLDHFKAINDAHGHPAGDAVLVATAEAVMRAVRVDDCVGRIGGEEVAVLLRGADLALAMKVAERLRAAVEQAAAQDRPEVAFTASFGVCEIEPGVGGATLWLAAADAALYRAKTSGRNRVCD